MTFPSSATVDILTAMTLAHALDGRDGIYELDRCDALHIAYCICTSKSINLIFFSKIIGVNEADILISFPSRGRTMTSFSNKGIYLKLRI